MVRAGEDRVEPRAFLLERYRKRILHRDETAPVIKAAGDARLIADQHHRNSQPVTARDGVGCARQHPEVLGPAEIIRILDDDPVAVEEQSRPAGSIEMSGREFAPAATRSLAR